VVCTACALSRKGRSLFEAYEREKMGRGVYINLLKLTRVNVNISRRCI